MITKVHRVCTASEAMHFEALGADLVGVSMAHDDHYDDDRVISAEFAREIAHGLDHAEFVLEPPRETSGEALVTLAQQTGARWIQTPLYATPDGGTRAELARAGIGLIVARVDADYDMDPEWVLGPVEDLGDPWPDLVEIEVMPSFSDSWRFLIERSPQCPDELQTDDIERLARERPILLSIDFTPDNVSDISQLIPSARGISLTLGILASGVSGLHVMSSDTVEAVLAVASGSKP